MPASGDLDRYCAREARGFEREFAEFLRFASVSSDVDHTADMLRCADFLRDACLRAGLRNAEVLPTAGHPAVYAERIVDPALPTVLIYGHYDVQPAGDSALWHSPPFEPATRDGRIYARGATDDKGPVFMHLKAIQACLAVYGELPVNLKLIVEGEEEIGSPNFEALLIRERTRLAADAVVISDTPMRARGVPTITTALRGLVALRVTVTTSSSELHSGQYGGAVPNPNEALARIIAALKDPLTGRVNVPGFYDGVRPPTPAEREGLSRMDLDEDGFRRQAGGVLATPGEIGWTVAERISVRPTLEINAMHGGDAGTGFKTSIPGAASASISCRLVQGQDPARIAAAVTQAIEAAATPGATVTVRTFSASPAVSTPPDNPVVAAVSAALSSVYRQTPQLTWSGGSNPAVGMLKRVLGVDSTLVALSNPDAGMHRPDEKMDRGQFHRGIRAMARLWGDNIRILASPRRPAPQLE